MIQQPAWALAGRPLIRTILQNLLDNAWKFTSGQDNASIEVRITPIGDTLPWCCVRDNGAGFDPDQAGRRFTPFQRLRASGKQPG
ncbi:MAG: ATP-binding protein [Streptosporangiaceae bacterium]